jgi:hypothetical protein
MRLPVGRQRTPFDRNQMSDRLTPRFKIGPQSANGRLVHGSDLDIDLLWQNTAYGPHSLCAGHIGNECYRDPGRQKTGCQLPHPVQSISLGRWRLGVPNEEACDNADVGRRMTGD